MDPYNRNKSKIQEMSMEFFKSTKEETWLNKIRNWISVDPGVQTLLTELEEKRLQ